jgi:hypothetical protein
MYSLADQYDDPMTKSAISLSQGLRILPLFSSLYPFFGRGEGSTARDDKYDELSVWKASF